MAASLRSSDFCIDLLIVTSCAVLSFSVTVVFSTSVTAPRRSFAAAPGRSCAGLALLSATARSRASPRTPAGADDGGHRKGHVANAVAAALHADETGRMRAAVEGDRFDHFLDRQADGEPGAPLFLDHFGARALGAREQLAGQVRRPAGIFFQRQAGDRGTRPDRHHAVAVFAQDQRLRLASGGAASRSAIRLRKRIVSSCVPRPSTCAGGRSSRSAAR